MCVKKKKKMCIKMTKRTSKKTSSKNEFISSFFFVQFFQFSEQFFQDSQFIQPQIFQQFNVFQSFSKYIFQFYQQFQSFQQFMLSDFQFSLIPEQSSKPIVEKKILNVDVFEIDLKRNFGFLNTMHEMNKAFRVFCSILNSNDNAIFVNKRFVQTNKKSNMNVINIDLIKKLKLKLHFLNEIEFREFFMKTTNHRKIVLHHGILIKIQIEKIVKNIRCFVVFCRAPAQVKVKDDVLTNDISR